MPMMHHLCDCCVLYFNFRLGIEELALLRVSDFTLTREVTMEEPSDLVDMIS
jgi:hypothetical protein